jgi:hypothetical protein
MFVATCEHSRWIALTTEHRPYAGQFCKLRIPGLVKGIVKGTETLCFKVFCWAGTVITGLPPSGFPLMHLIL